MPACVRACVCFCCSRTFSLKASARNDYTGHREVILKRREHTTDRSLKGTLLSNRLTLLPRRSRSASFTLHSIARTSDHSSYSGILAGQVASDT